MSDGRELADAMDGNEAERDLARANMIAAERERDEYAARAEAAEALAAEYGAKWQAAVERAERLLGDVVGQGEVIATLEAEVERLGVELADAEEAIIRRDTDVAMHAGRWQRAEAVVERLRAKLDAAREARQRLFLGGTSGLIAGVARMGLRDLDAALAPDAKAQSEPIADQSAAQCADLDARLRRLAEKWPGVELQYTDPGWRMHVYRDFLVEGFTAGPTPTAAVAALEAAMEGDDG